MCFIVKKKIFLNEVMFDPESLLFSWEKNQGYICNMKKDG